MNTVHLKKAINDPEIRILLRYINAPFMQRVDLLKIVEGYETFNMPVPDYFMAGIDSRLDEDILPNVLSVFITTLEVKDAQELRTWSRIGIFFSDRFFSLAGRTGLLLRRLSNRARSHG